MTLVDELLALGIAEDVALQAAEENDDLDAALDWISSRQDAQTVLVCDECARRFGTAELAQLHAASEGHASFSQAEKGALSPEEVAAKLAALRERLQEKRALEKEGEAARSAELERIRRKAGAASQEARAEAKEKAAKMAADEARRQRAEDAETLKRIRAEMAAEKAAKQRATQTHTVVPDTSTSAKTTPVSAPPAVPCDRCRLQVRLPGGGVFRETFAPTDTLDDVITGLSSAGNVLPQSFRLVVPIPRRELQPFSACLSALGLLPSATLVLEPL